MGLALPERINGASRGTTAHRCQRWRTEIGPCHPHQAAEASAQPVSPPVGSLPHLDALPMNRAVGTTRELDLAESTKASYDFVLLLIFLETLMQQEIAVSINTTETILCSNSLWMESPRELIFSHPSRSFLSTQKLFSYERCHSPT